MENLGRVGRMVDMSESLLAEDSKFSQLPLSLVAITEQLNDNVTHHDYTVALLLVLVAESGFRIWSALNTKMPQNSRLVHIPKDWKVTDKDSCIYQIHLVYKNLMNTESKLVAIPLGDRLIVNFCSCVGEKMICSMSVQCLKYVNPHSDNLNLRFMNLKELSHKFKNKMVTPIRTEILSTLNLTSPSLQGLPQELKIEILSMLHVWEISRVKLCSKTLYQSCKDSALRTKLFEEEFYQVCAKVHRP